MKRPIGSGARSVASLAAAFRPAQRSLSQFICARKPNETLMVQVTAMIALSERLRKQSRKVSNHEAIADLQLATRYLRQLAALKIADEVDAETDPGRKAQLEREFIQLYSQFLAYTDSWVCCARSPN
jgi:hypothetical protein